MSRLRFRGQVSYLTGVPVPDANVVLIDKDRGRSLLGTDDDVLWTGKTDNNGIFSGETIDWKADEFMDILFLWFKVDKPGYFHEGPFVRINDTTSAPIIVPWQEMPVEGFVLVPRITAPPSVSPLDDVQVKLYTLDLEQRQGVQEVLSSTTDSNGHFSGTVRVGLLPLSLAFWFECRKGSDFFCGIFAPLFNNIIIVPWGLNPLAWKIVNHGPDAADGRAVASNYRGQVEIFNFASIRVDNYKRFNYKDSGQRFSFRLNNDGVLKYCETSPGSNFRGDWNDFIPLNPLNLKAISYLKKRAGESIETPKFDLITAGGNRILAKEKGSDRLFFTIIDELFWQYKDVNNTMDTKDIRVPGIYFKLDPEAGIPGAQNRDSISQLDGDFNNHPETTRWPVYRTCIGSGLSGMMIVSKKPRVWYQIDSRPPCDSKAEIPSKFPRYSHITYANALFPDLRQDEYSINFQSVLDLGVGSVHRHENYSEIYGGEMQPLLTDIYGFSFYLHLYQFFNGQVRDGDGFIDGTCNYYMLVKLDDTNSSHQKYALLFIDEQMIFSKRWRAVDLSDYLPDSFIPPNFLFATELKSKPDVYFDQYRFESNKFWCPFSSGCVNDNSRLAVARQIIAINGEDAGEQQIFTINYSWGTCDRTWRWRSLPEGTKAVIVHPRSRYDGMHGDPADINAVRDPHAPDTPVRVNTSSREVISRDDNVFVTSENRDVDIVYPETIKVRDDSTLVLKGIKRFLTHDNKTRYYIGRYFQKYLPADLKMPDPKEGKPDGFAHDWQFVKESIYKSMDSYSHFGVYENVDSRSQYYLLEVSDSDAKKLKHDLFWEDVNETLSIECPRINWDDISRRATAGNFGTVVNIDSFPIRFEDVRPLSMFNKATYFRVTYKEGLGYIATFWDKRDDDLKPVKNVPQTVNLVAWSEGLKRRNENIKIEVRFKEHQEMTVPPLVTNATLSLNLDTSGEISRASVSFVLPEYIFLKKEKRQGPDVNKCIWRVVVAALSDSEGVVKVFDRKRAGEFHNTDENQFTFTCDFIPTAREKELLSRHFTPETYWQSGATIWFEDVVGQKNIAQETKFEIVKPR